MRYSYHSSDKCEPDTMSKSLMVIHFAPLHFNFHFNVKARASMHKMHKILCFHEIRSDRPGRTMQGKLEPKQAGSFGDLLTRASIVRKHCFRSRKCTCGRALIPVIMLGSYRGRQLGYGLVDELVSDYVV